MPALYPSRLPAQANADDLRFALSLGVDMIALSFVRRPEDVAVVRAAWMSPAGVSRSLPRPGGGEGPVLGDLFDEGCRHLISHHRQQRVGVGVPAGAGEAGCR